MRFTETQMPVINLDTLRGDLSPEDLELVQGIIATRGANKGRLRASKPDLPKKVEKVGGMFGTYFDYADEAGAKAGKIAYLWRHVAFGASPISQHQCMPCLDFCDLPHLPSDERRALEKHLIDLASQVLATIPLKQQYGTVRWGRALGML